MAWVGWFQYGNTVIINNEMAKGVAQSYNAPFTWFVDPTQPTVQPAVDPGLAGYSWSQVENMPWYDPLIPESSRFFGVYCLGVAGMIDSTRQTAVIENILEGGSLGIPRRATKSSKFTCVLAAQGRDALEYGFEWLDAVLDSQACGMHGNICGVSDLQFYSDVPPPFQQVLDYTGWTLQATNLATNPSFETAASSTIVRTNLSTNPNAQAAVGFLSNNSSVNTTTRDVAITGHPQGITTAASSVINAGQTNSSILNQYNVDSLGNTAAAHYLGCWVMVTNSGYKAYWYHDGSATAITLSANTWTWVPAQTEIAANTYSEFVIYTANGSTPPTTDTAYITGVEAEAIPISSSLQTIWGGRPADTDLSYAWTGSANGSTSTATGLEVAGVTQSGAACVQSEQWSSDRTHSMRIIPTSASTNVAMGIIRNLTSADAGVTYTLTATLYLQAPTTFNGVAARSFFMTTDQGNLQGPQMPNVAGAYQLTWTVTVPVGTTTGTFRIYNGEAAGGQDLWVDGLTIVASSSYDGAYFDGATADDSLDEYSWTGAADASTSTWQSRTSYYRLQTYDEYLPSLLTYQRFLHGVGTIDGPHIDQEIENEGFNVYIVDFTLNATRPYVYTATNQLTLPPQIPIVYNDIPYNLEPYPSMELTDGTTPVVATNFMTNPSVETDTTGWTAAATNVSGTVGSYFTSGRVTGELSSAGNSSFRARILGDGSTSASGEAKIDISQIADLSSVAATAVRPSCTVWGAVIVSAGASGSTIHSLKATLNWMNSSGTVIGTPVVLGTAPSFNGYVFSGVQQAPPTGWAKAQIVVEADVSWSSSATPADNSDIRVYVDAMGVTVP